MESRHAVVLVQRRAQVRQAVEESQRCLVVLTGVLTIGVTPIKFPTGEDGSLNPDLQIVVNGIAFQNNFGGSAGLSFPSASGSSGVDVSHLLRPALQGRT
jgi:hypothetical protein